VSLCARIVTKREARPLALVMGFGQREGRTLLSMLGCIYHLMKGRVRRRWLQ